jgi:hypothetical protein
VHRADARAQLLQRAGRQLPRLCAQRLHFAFTGSQRGAEHTQQRGLARARGADDGDRAISVAPASARWPLGSRRCIERAVAVGMHQQPQLASGRAMPPALNLT